MKDRFIASSPSAGCGREGEIANGRFGAFRFAKPGLGRLAGLEKVDRPLGVTSRQRTLNQTGRRRSAFPIPEITLQILGGMQIFTCAITDFRAYSCSENCTWLVSIHWGYRTQVESG